ncbi:hypothetical protein N9B17_00910 [Rhodopirellula sp.]|nr:hypothetical protein [Rhodopirellula sp.]
MTSRKAQGDQYLESQGPAPFITRRVHRLGDGMLAVWSSRHHRKHLPPPETLVVGVIRRDCLRGWWLTRDFNWWIGLVFVVGALLFIFGSVCTLWPKLPIVGSLILPVFFSVAQSRLPWQHFFSSIRQEMRQIFRRVILLQFNEKHFNINCLDVAPANLDGGVVCCS